MPKNPIARAAAKGKKPKMQLMMKSERIDATTGKSTLLGNKPTTAREKAMYAKVKPQATLKEQMVEETTFTPGRASGRKAVKLARKKKP